MKKMLWRTLGVVRDRFRALAGVRGLLAGRLSAFCAPRAFRLKLGYVDALLEGALAHHLFWA